MDLKALLKSVLKRTWFGCFFNNSSARWLTVSHPALQPTPYWYSSKYCWMSAQKNGSARLCKKVCPPSDFARSIRVGYWRPTTHWAKRKAVLLHQVGQGLGPEGLETQRLARDVERQLHRELLWPIEPSLPLGYPLWPSLPPDSN